MTKSTINTFLCKFIIFHMGPQLKPRSEEARSVDYSGEKHHPGTVLDSERERPIQDELNLRPNVNGRSAYCHCSSRRGFRAVLVNLCNVEDAQVSFNFFRR